MVGFANESTPKRKQEGTALRQRFIDHLTLSGRARRTIETYVGWVRRLAAFHRRAPDRLSEVEVREFLLDLHRKKRAFSTINQAVNALRCFYGGLLGWKELSLKGCLPRPGSAKKAPRAYSPEQIDSLLRAARDYDILHYSFLSCLYHTGMRLNEGCYLRFSEIERSSQRILVKAGKGNKDRYTLLPGWLMEDFDNYFHRYRKHRPLEGRWMFVGKRSDARQPLRDGSAQSIFYTAREKAGLPDIGGIHVLRHSFASHHLRAGMDLARLRAVLGHRNLTTTLRYLHLVEDGESSHYDPRVSPLQSLRSRR